jgi:hypothetical protein
MSYVSEVCGGGDAGRDLVPGALRGYRTWRLLRWRTQVPDGTLPLTSVTRRRVVWGPSLTARCKRGDHGTRGGPRRSTTTRYDLNLWIGVPFEGATYLPR